MTKENLYDRSIILLKLLDGWTNESHITVNVNRHRLDPTWRKFHEFIDNMIHEGLLKKYVLLNYRVYDEDERKPCMFIDIVKNEPEAIEKYMKNIYFKTNLRIAHGFYFKAMDIANDLNNLHGGKTKEIEELDKLFHNTYK